MAPRQAAKRAGHASHSRVCVYCGHPLTPEQARRWPGTCIQHDDLPKRDPLYMLSLRGGQR